MIARTLLVPVLIAGAAVTLAGCIDQQPSPYYGSQSPYYGSNQPYYPPQQDQRYYPPQDQRYYPPQQQQQYYPPQPPCDSRYYDCTPRRY